MEVLVRWLSWDVWNQGKAATSGKVKAVTVGVDVCGWGK